LALVNEYASWICGRQGTFGRERSQRISGGDIDQGCGFARHRQADAFVDLGSGGECDRLEFNDSPILPVEDPTTSLNETSFRGEFFQDLLQKVSREQPAQLLGTDLVLGKGAHQM